MKTEIKWAELHAPLFLNGTNLGAKLDPNKRQGLSMEYDEEKRHLYVTLETGQTTGVARVPEPAILSLVEGAAKKPAAVMPPPGPIKAQVSTPQDHVHQGDGKGKR